MISIGVTIFEEVGLFLSWNPARGIHLLSVVKPIHAARIILVFRSVRAVKDSPLKKLDEKNLRSIGNGMKTDEPKLSSDVNIRQEK